LDSCTGEKLHDMFKSIFEHWNLAQKHIFATIDGGTNIGKGLHLCSNITTISCFGHNLNLIIKVIIIFTKFILKHALDPFQNLINKGRTLIGYFNRSTVASDALKRIQNSFEIKSPLKLIQDVPTRWNSTYDMFERLLHLKKFIMMTLVELDHQEMNFSNSEWEKIQQITNILEIFKVSGLF